MSFYKKHKTIINISILFLLSRLPMIIFLLLHKFGIVLNNTSGVLFIDKSSSLFLYLYDGAHYLNIAGSGYSVNNLFAFFPLYPFLIRLLHMMHISLSTAGIIISNVSFFLSLLVLNTMLKKSKNRNIILALYAFSPILSFTTMCYTESIYLLLTILTFYYYKKKEYLISSFFLGLSMLTRNTGYILMGAILIDMLYKYFKKDNIKFINIFKYSLIAISIGMIYPIYLFIKTGDFLYFSTIQFDYWQRANGYVVLTIINDIKFLIHNLNVSYIYIFSLNWIFFLIAIIIGIKIYKKDKVSSIYLIVSALLCAFTYRIHMDSDSVLPSISLFRYVFTLFPLYLYLPSIKIKNINIRVLLYVLYFIIVLINTIGIYCGGFIA